MGLLAAVGSQTRVGVEPFGALDAVMAAETGKILAGLGFFELSKVSGRTEVGLDLIDVPKATVSLA